MKDAYIYDAIRTPRGKGKRDGSLYEVKPVDLLKTLFTAMKERNRLDTSKVDDVVLGCVTPIGDQGADIARTAVLYSGWDESVAGVTLNRFCASGLEAVNMAAMKVQSGAEEMAVGGGVESMSRIPMGSDGGALFLDPRVNEAINFIPQGVSADLLATLEGFTRKDVDIFAAGSHAKAHQAVTEKRFKSIIPVKDINGSMILDHDETIRKETTPEVLAGLKPSFKLMGDLGFDSSAQMKYPQIEAIDHVHHAGNSSGIVDGSALVLVGNRRAGETQGLKPRARFLSVAVTGSEPTIMLTGPVASSRKALKKAGMSILDIDLFEINEAFAAVVLKVIRDLAIDPARVNVNGGAIAMGHPLGATGAILLGTLLDELERRDKATGLCTLCVGGGMGITTIIERV